MGSHHCSCCVHYFKSVIFPRLRCVCPAWWSVLTVSLDPSDSIVISSTGGLIPCTMRMPLTNPVMPLVCARLSRREGYQWWCSLRRWVCLGPFDSVGFASVPREQVCMQRQVCHVSGVNRCLRVMGFDRGCRKWGLEWVCLGWWARCGVLMMSTLESLSRRRRMKDRSPRGPPSACRALSSSPKLSW